MNRERLFKVLLGPHVSEKTTSVTEDQYTFKVAIDATKPEVKAAVEALFNVSVEDVRILRVKGKSKRNRYGVNKRPDWKKAYVRIGQGQEIDFAIAG